MLLPHLITIWFLSLSRTNPLPLHPLLHLISLSPSIQIVFIGMTGPVVGDSHRHGRTMHCDGDIHMIMPSDLTLLQIRFSFFPTLCISLCLDVYDCVLTFQTISMCCSLFMLCPSLPLHHSDFSPSFCSSMSVSLPYFFSPFSPNTMLAITLNNFHSHGFWQYFF